MKLFHREGMRLLGYVDTLPFCLIMGQEMKDGCLAKLNVHMLVGSDYLSRCLALQYCMCSTMMA